MATKKRVRIVSDADLAPEPANDGGSAASPAPLTPDQQWLFDLGFPMMYRCAGEIARRYHGLVTAQELLAPGTIALREAVFAYKEGKHKSFPVYARFHLLGRMIDALRVEHFSPSALVERAMDRAFAIASAHHVVDVDLVGGEMTAIAGGVKKAGAELMAATYLAGVRAAEPADAEARVVDHLAIERAVARLPAHEEEVIRLVLEDLTLDEAAAELGVSLSTVQRRYASALDKLHAFFVERGEEGG